jgi:hypothetical protein
MAPMTVEELLQHPEYPHTIWPLQPESQGRLPVAKDRGGPFNIAYEVHGRGDRHLVVRGPTLGITPWPWMCAAPEACSNHHLSTATVSFRMHLPSQHLPGVSGC